MAKESIKLPRSSYEELRKIIVAYSKLDKPCSLDEISQLSGIGRTIVSNNNAFLTATGIIEGGKLKFPTDRGIVLAHSLEHEIPEEVEKAWRAIVQENEFLNKLLQAISIRKGMELSQLETHIAYSAGESKSKAVMTGARTVVDILRASGMVTEEDGQIKSKPAALDFVVNPPLDERISFPPGTDVTIKTHIQQVPLTVHIEVRINATPSEIDGLGDKLKGLIASLVQAKSDDRS